MWGGEKLGRLLGKSIGGEKNYAESWEVVDHGDDQSVVENGELAGQTLAQLVSADRKCGRKWLMGETSDASSFPLLLKYLDCNRVLSVQVHPDDAYGAKMTVPDLGKTEAWYVVDAEPDSLVYAGLKDGVDQAMLADAMAAGQTDSVLHCFVATAGDCVFIPAGTVHALGAGLVIAEIQQSSNTTFRLFDWNRVNAQGESRPLHIEQSLAVTDYTSGPVRPGKSDRQRAGWQSLVRCDKFCLSVIETGQAKIGGDGQFHLLTVPRGSVMLDTPDQNQTITAGGTVMLPASMPECEVTVQPGGAMLASSPGH
ncbi:MAG: type I phosphomannose isomerase catalytic subunit [Planctomycetota bacterium]